MALTESTMKELGSALPSFSLPDVLTGRMVSPEAYADRKALLVMFLCRHCPYVKHIEQELARLARDYENRSLGIIAISSNDAAAYPDDAPESLKEQALQLGFRFPYCYDESQDVARAFQAACTPDFFLYGPERRLVYRGQFDDSRPGNGKPVTGRDLRAAIDAMLEDKPVSADQKPSAGCNIKLKAAL